MGPNELSIILQRLKHASRSAATTGLMLALAGGLAEAGETRFGPEQVLPSIATTKAAVSISGADLDGDGDQDILTASFGDSKISWYENLDGLGKFGPQSVITTLAASATWACSADLDGDGDLDVLSASLGDARIAWYENTDGRGAFGPQQTITTSALWAQMVSVADLDGDGDLDVLSASFFDHKIAWYENTDGKGGFSGQRIITTSAFHAYAVYPVDLDNDGDQDVISASTLDDKIAWYENVDGNGSFGPQRVINIADSDPFREGGNGNADGADGVFAADLDGDGDFDVLSSSGADNKIAWYENLDGLGSFGPQRTITTSADGPNDVYAADLDGDGDLDVLSASGLNDTVEWYENTNGKGEFGPPRIISTTADFAMVASAADLDGDGDLDVLSASFRDDKFAWYENLTQPKPNAVLHWESYE